MLVSNIFAKKKKMIFICSYFLIVTESASVVGLFRWWGDEHKEQEAARWFVS